MVCYGFRGLHKTSGALGIVRNIPAFVDLLQSAPARNDNLLSCAFCREDSLEDPAIGFGGISYRNYNKEPPK